MAKKKTTKKAKEVADDEFEAVTAKAQDKGIGKDAVRALTEDKADGLGAAADECTSGSIRVVV